MRRRGALRLEPVLEAAIRAAPRTIGDLREIVAERDPGAVARIERALQRLRGAGRVHLLHRLWARPDVVTCGTCAGRGWTPRPAGGGACCAGCAGAGWIDTAKAGDARHVDASE